MDDNEELIDVSIRLPRALIETSLARLTPGDRASRRLALAKWILSIRRRRPLELADVRFGEPTWDMLLELYISDQEVRKIDVMGLCLASGVAQATAHRYLEILAGGRHIIKQIDEKDHRRSFVTMSPVLRASMDTWLERAEIALGLTGLQGRASSTGTGLSG